MEYKPAASLIQNQNHIYPLNSSLPWTSVERCLSSVPGFWTLIFSLTLKGLEVVSEESQIQIPSMLSVLLGVLSDTAVQRQAGCLRAGASGLMYPIFRASKGLSSHFLGLVDLWGLMACEVVTVSWTDTTCQNSPNGEWTLLVRRTVLEVEWAKVTSHDSD